ncbi:MAG: hypothetical protein HQK54_09330 [Oligoflexales bacterium]|nr:hypothetical protein [Oligoflexales bacterium]
MKRSIPAKTIKYIQFQKKYHHLPAAGFKGKRIIMEGKNRRIDEIETSNLTP